MSVLVGVETRGAYVGPLLDAAANQQRLSPQNRALATELVYGVLRRRNKLDWLIQQQLRRPSAKVTAWVRNILLLGAYQLLHLSQVPPYAAVSEAVKLASRFGYPGSPGFVNAVLHKIKGLRGKPSPVPKGDFIRYLAVEYSHPEWLVAKWIRRFGEKEAERICQANQEHPQLTIRVNTLKANRQEVYEQLTNEGWEPHKLDSLTEALRLSGAKNFAAGRLYGQGLVEVQSVASMLAGKVLSPRPGEKVLDVCAGRGGKTGHLAQLMENKGLLLAMDHHRRKLEQLQRSSCRLGVNIVHSAAIDAAAEMGLKIKFDRILVDAPCSSLGLLARHPEIRYRQTPEELPRLKALQRGILENAANRLRFGGVLVYSTCSFEPEETEKVIGPFLEAHPELKPEDLGAYLPPSWAGHAGTFGLRLFPCQQNPDGFFISRLRSTKQMQ